VAVSVVRSRPRHARRAPRLTGGVEGNARLTGALGALLFVLLAAEGLTIAGIGPLLGPHVLIGTLLVPVVAAKVGSTGWRALRYYRGDPEYVRRGPPPALMRLLGPLVVVLTAAVLASGVGLLVGPRSTRAGLLLAHRATFVLWFGVMTVHVLAHVVESARLAPRDWVARTRRQVAGATRRQWVVVSCLVAGAVGGAALWPYATGWWATLG
jgi:hypothetical protein